MRLNNLLAKIIGVTVSNDKIIFNVKVKPGAKTIGIEANEQGDIVVKVRERPIEGQANSAVIEALSEYFSIAKSRIFLVGGGKSKLKRFAISLSGRDDNEVREKLARLIEK